MSIASTTSRNNYTGNAATHVYAYSFRIFAKTDLRVTVRNTSGTQTTMTVDTDYTVSGVGSASGGSVTLVNSSQAWLTSGELKSGYKLTIRRVRPLTQSTDIRNQGDFYPETHEDAFDHAVMIGQQHQDEIDRSTKLPETVAVADFDPTLPSDIVGSESCALVTNSDGDGFSVGPTTSAISNAQSNAVAAAASASAAAASAASAALSVIDIVNASQFGAVADFSTDQTDKVQDAVDSFGVNGGTLFINKGVKWDYRDVVIPDEIAIYDYSTYDPTISEFGGRYNIFLQTDNAGDKNANAVSIIANWHPALILNNTDDTGASTDGSIVWQQEGNNYWQLDKSHFTGDNDFVLVGRTPSGGSFGSTVMRVKELTGKMDLAYGLGIANGTVTNLLSIGTDLGSLTSGNVAAIGSSSDTAGWYVGQGNSDFGFLRWEYNATAANRALRIHSGATSQSQTDIYLQNGFVGINNSAPTVSLDVMGAFRLSGVSTFSALTATTVPYLDSSKHLTSSSVTPTELGYLSGVSSAIQTQMNLKAPLASPTFTGTVTVPTSFVLGATTVTSTGTQLNYLNAATGTTGTTSSSLVYSASPTFTGTTAHAAGTFSSTLKATGIITAGDGTNTTASVKIGAIANAINAGSVLAFNNSNTSKNWEISTNLRGSGGDFNICASTTAGMTDFATPIFSMTNVGAITIPGGIVGSADGSNATAGNLGEYKESLVSSFTNLPGATTVWANLTSLSLTAGDWDITGIVNTTLNGSTITLDTPTAISVNSGATTTDHVEASNVARGLTPTSAADRTAVVPAYRLSLSGTTTVYLKLMATYSAGNPQFKCRLSARRVR